MTERKKPGIAFWTTVTVAVLVAYPALLGPSCWISSRTEWGADVVTGIYGPLYRLIAGDGAEPKYRQKWLDWYSRLGAREDWNWVGIYSGTNLILHDEVVPIHSDVVDIIPDLRIEWRWQDFGGWEGDGPVF